MNRQGQTIRHTSSDDWVSDALTISERRSSTSAISLAIDGSADAVGMTGAAVALTTEALDASAGYISHVSTTILSIFSATNDSPVQRRNIRVCGSFSPPTLASPWVRCIPAVGLRGISHN